MSLSKEHHDKLRDQEWRLLFDSATQSRPESYGNHVPKEFQKDTFLVKSFFIDLDSSNSGDYYSYNKQLKPYIAAYVVVISNMKQCWVEVLDVEDLMERAKEMRSSFDHDDDQQIKALLQTLENLLQISFLGISSTPSSDMAIDEAEKRSPVGTTLAKGKGNGKARGKTSTSSVLPPAVPIEPPQPTYPQRIEIVNGKIDYSGIMPWVFKCEPLTFLASDNDNGDSPQDARSPSLLPFTRFANINNAGTKRRLLDIGSDDEGSDHDDALLPSEAEINKRYPGTSVGGSSLMSGFLDRINGGDKSNNGALNSRNNNQRQGTQDACNLFLYDHLVLPLIALLNSSHRQIRSLEHVIQAKENELAEVMDLWKDEHERYSNNPGAPLPKRRFATLAFEKSDFDTNSKSELERMTVFPKALDIPRKLFTLKNLHAPPPASKDSKAGATVKKSLKKGNNSNNKNGGDGDNEEDVEMTTTGATAVVATGATVANDFRLVTKNTVPLPPRLLQETINADSFGMGGSSTQTSSIDYANMVLQSGQYADPSQASLAPIRGNSTAATAGGESRGAETATPLQPAGPLRSTRAPALSIQPKEIKTPEQIRQELQERERLESLKEKQKKKKKIM